MKNAFMTKSTQNFKLLDQRSFLLSFFLHILILGGVIITFPVNDVARKPLLIFLGSILDPRDFSRLPSEFTSSREIKIQLEEIPVLTRAYPQQDLLSNTKPSYTGVIDSGPKQLTKSRFLDKASPAAVQPVEIPDWVKTIFDYQPLSLRNHRQENTP